MKKKIKICCCLLSCFDTDENDGEELKILPNKNEETEQSSPYLSRQSMLKNIDSNTQSRIINENNISIKDIEMDNLQLLKNIEKDHKLYQYWYEEEMKNNKNMKLKLNISNEKIQPLSPIFNILNEKIHPLSPRFNTSNEEIPSLSPSSQLSDEEISQILQVPQNTPQMSSSNSFDNLNNSLTINIAPNFSYLLN